ncbi:carbohydrate ABC transporter permease [Paenibacillus sp. J5C_2022]|uniref:carbohydrate ABC transporter permease n=1 Tax=Paenibacillus sp. J5C2022 TaxID=2977129 RepID=UPI0021CFF168|nr:carbohydrate ABC transporter permease [Paenibacillus sp. J5C2022]MCU6710953.1 carbohydrate ABC transporter permease [Paenibacillus sp. J5C2022]
MVEPTAWGRQTFLIVNYACMLIVALLCLFPIVHVFAVSLSSSSAAATGQVFLSPVDVTTKAYQYVLDKEQFWKAITVSVYRVVMGCSLQMILLVLIAYPLSKEARTFSFRTAYAWIFYITMLFSGGLIPAYMTVKETGILNTIWALVLPNAVAVYSVILLLNFFRGLPKALEESAFIDGAGHFTIMWRIYLPLSKPALATLLLFSIVGQWNAWFDGIIYMNRPELYPLQSYLQTLIVDSNINQMMELSDESMQELSDRTLKSAQIFIGALPVLLVYPFLQKFFMKGIVLGSVKE